MGVDPAQAKEALESALRSLEVDDDTIEGLVDIVVDAASENSDADARELAGRLEEALEPFLLAFGAETTAIPGTAMQVAVSIRGMPELQAVSVAKPAAQSSPEPAAAQAPTKAVDDGKPGITLASFCSKAPTAAKQSKPASDGGYKPNGPRTLGAMFNSEVDPHGQTSEVWQTGLQLGETAEPDLEDQGVAAEDWQAALKEPANRGRQAQEAASAASKKKAGGTKAARRAAAASATSAAPGPAESESLGNVAEHGLRETQEALAGGAAAGRGVHREGAGSRNIHLEDVNLSLIGDQGSRDLLKDANLHLSPGHVYGLVGKNGTGKTTFLRRLATKALPGMPMHLRFGYVAQEQAGANGEETALEAVVSSDEERTALLKERDELEASLAGAEDLRDSAEVVAAEARAARFTEVVRQLELIDADGAEDRAREALRWLNFDEAGTNMPVSNMSGGWRMRLALAKALCGRPDVLLLDEPTNHLDLHGVFWLQNHLRREFGEKSQKKDRIVVVVSHDKTFLDECATDILEIHAMKLRTFTGNYTDYLRQISHEQTCLQLQENEIERQERQAKKDLSAMKKKAREHADDKKVRQLKSKEKKFERSTQAQREGREFKLSSRREDGGGDLISKLRQDVDLRFKFPECECPGDDANLLELDSAKVRQGKTVILQNITLTLDPYSRVAIVGGNGTGKSTLMRALGGELKAEEGARSRGRVNPAFAPGFVSQNHLERQATHLQHSALEYLRDHLPDQNTVRGASMTKQSDDSVLRAHLGNFGLGNDALKKIGYLSGGQKARLSLAVSTWFGPNVLLLDEPTNHLDVDSLDALSLGLQAFEGAVVVVSHNRGFLEAMCDELWIVKGGGVKACPRGEEAFSDYFADYTKSVKSGLR